MDADQDLAKLIAAKRLITQSAKNIDLAQLISAREFLITACRNLVRSVLDSVICINVRGWEEVVWISRLARDLELANAGLPVADPSQDFETMPRRFLDLVMDTEPPAPDGESSEVRLTGVQLAERVIREARTVPVDG